jgi:NAD(P)-dependent dehydrogenase (short-subunit alcohol dehydrogenase family)
MRAEPVKDLAGRVAVITGGGSGIGRAAAGALAAEGVSLVLAGTTAERLDDAANEIGGVAAATLVCDVTEPDSFERLRDLALSRFGRVDIVMNNAGALSVGYPEDIPLDEWRRVFDVNVMALVRSNQIFLPILLAQGSGHLVNTASVDGLFGFGYDRLPYAASKAAVVSLSEGLALYLKPRGIGVTCFCPGPVATNIGGSMRHFGRPLAIHGAGEQFHMMPAAEAAAAIVEAIRENRFLVPTHAVTREIVRRRAEDPDAFVDHQIRHPQVIFTIEGQASLPRLD